MDIAAGDGNAACNAAGKRLVDCPRIRAAARALAQLERDAGFLGCALERLEHLGLYNGAAIHKGDGRAAAHLRYMLMALGSGHIIGSGALEGNRHIGLHVINGRLRAAQAQLLLHGKHSVKIARIGVLQQFQCNCAANAVVQRLRFHSVFPQALPFRGKAYIIARADIFERVRLILCADVNEQLAVPQRAGKFLLTLEMDGLRANHAWHLVRADHHAL